ncbi:MAG: polymer-forming cytoskeletal protein [Thermoanaerobaculia bacterium]
MQPSIISAGTELSGRLSLDSDLDVQGRICGDVAIQGALVVSAGGYIEGRVSARSVTVAGGVRGDIHGTDRVEVLGGGSVVGGIAAPIVVLGEGSEHDGAIELVDG